MLEDAPGRISRWSLFFLVNLAEGLSILYFQEASFFFDWFFLFFWSLSFISALVFMISTNWVLFVLSLVALGVRLGLFPDVKLYGYKLPLRTAFPTSHWFWVVLFSFVSRYFLWFLQWSIDFLVAYCLASTCLCFLQVFSCSWFLIS